MNIHTTEAVPINCPPSFPWSDWAFWGLILLIVVNLFTMISWLWEHLWRNYFDRYKIQSAHSPEWLKEHSDALKLAFIRGGLFNEVKRFEKWQGGSIYCFCLINKGTTHDFIYSAKLKNSNGKEIDISTEHILKGYLYTKNDIQRYEYVFENLPHGLSALQGEVWFVAVDDDDFIDVRSPILIIQTAVKKYDLGLTEAMHVRSIGTKAYNQDIK